MLPVLKAMLEQFPFRIQDFHSPNGSEFINRTGNGLLKKLLVEQTKSRQRQWFGRNQVWGSDQQHMRYTHIAAPLAAAIETFSKEYFNPYVNFRRPCAVPEQVVNAKGKIKSVYRWYATP